MFKIGIFAVYSYTTTQVCRHIHLIAVPATWPRWRDVQCLVVVITVSLSFYSRASFDVPHQEYDDNTGTDGDTSEDSDDYNDSHTHTATKGWKTHHIIVPTSLSGQSLIINTDSML